MQLIIQHNSHQTQIALGIRLVHLGKHAQSPTPFIGRFEFDASAAFFVRIGAHAR